MGLTIGQLADHVGVTVRAIRLYHQRGLLPEPRRDASGYRRYDAGAVVALVRIKVLSAAGVPLARMQELIGADEDSFAAAVAGIDRTLEDRIGELEHRRRQLRVLLSGDRLVLPAEVVELLGELRAMGASERSVRLERDGWVLMTAMCPDVVDLWVAQKRLALQDEEFRRLYLVYDEARDWEPGDPRLEEFGRWMIDWAGTRREELIGTVDVDPTRLASVAAAEALLTERMAAESPGWKHLAELAASASLDPPYGPGPPAGAATPSD